MRSTFKGKSICYQNSNDMSINFTKKRTMIEVSKNDSMSDDILHKALSSAEIPFDRKVSLADITYMRTGGVAGTIIYPETSEELARSLKILADLSFPYKVVGATSNLLFLDDTSYRCLVSTVRLNKMRFDAENGQIVAEAGVMLPDLSRLALWNLVSGLEGLEGIPGTVGGAIFMNAGAYGDEIKDTLVAVDIAYEDGTIQRREASAIGLSHRSSGFRRGDLEGVVCCCYFVGKRGQEQSIVRKMELFHAKRHKYQDFFYPNLGSIFSGSPYRALGERDRVFKFISAAYYAICYEWKPFRRESPMNRKWLNDIVLKRFPLEYELQPFSDKTLNCLVNRGQGTAEMCRFIDQMKVLTDGRIPIENEVVEGF